ncbi:myb/SANT-like DNA-binding domain-containing protein 3 [Ischnura elegans]|uniref:myb/SANT-like DNA-binding domain-containing protein 3 n=1 Tax=Ischnura elegans TaxID=197161 RepID=UPI001ED87F5D|nr:myb/SANT-like DNA-binding domain-containing protein 3 [Ischnura elegans]
MSQGIKSNIVTVATRHERMTNRERNLLISLVQKDREIIDTKKCDMATLQAKMKCWQKVADRFNSHGNVTQRSWKRLRKAWDNIKMRRKRTLATRVREIVETGGGTNVTIEDPTGEFPSIILQELNVEDFDLQSHNVGGTEGVNVPKQTEEGTEGPSRVAAQDIRVESLLAGSTSSNITTSRQRKAAINKVLEERMTKLNEETGNNRELHTLRKDILELKKREHELDVLIKEEILQEHRAEAKRKQEIHDVKLELLRKSQMACPNFTL